MSVRATRAHLHASVPGMAVDLGIRSTSLDRRANIIKSLSREMDPKDPTSAAARLAALIADPTPRRLIMSGDIDGLIAAFMLTTVAPHWSVVAVVARSQEVWLHPSVADDVLIDDTWFGVDVFSTHFDSISNHVALWGRKRLGSSRDALSASNAYDMEIQRRGQNRLFANASLWAGIEASVNTATVSQASRYRYPLGTAQLTLALLEVIGRSPRMFDREYLPWLVANCDGGLESVRAFPSNVPMWWGALAAAVGPASLSEQLYQLAMTQRPTAFIDIVNSLRAEGAGDGDAVAGVLTDDWNIRPVSPDAVQRVGEWIEALSGWRTPFAGGSVDDSWTRKPLDGFLVGTSGLPGWGDPLSPIDTFRWGLGQSLEAVHTSFAHFDGSQRLAWVDLWPGAAFATSEPLPPELAVAGEPGVPSQPVPEDLLN